MNKLANAPDEKVDEINDKMDEAIEKIRMSEPYSISSLAKSFLTFIAIFSIFGVLLALILKKKTPEQEY